MNNLSYSEFINSLGYGVSMLFNGISQVASSLLSNYIVITILGLSLFTFVIYTLIDIIFSVHKSKENLDNYGSDKK